MNTTPSPEDFTRILAEYSATFGAELASKVKRLDLLLGEHHWLSVGNYKESIIREQLSNKLPRRFEVGTGFVLTRREEKRLISRQIDILVWDSSEYPPYFRDGQFVIIPPEACRAAIEVKGVLDHQALTEAIENLDSLTQFRDYIPRPAVLNRTIFAFEVAKNLKFPQSAWNSLFKCYSSPNAPMTLDERIAWSRGDVETWTQPWISNVVVLGAGVLNAEFWGTKDNQDLIAYVGYQAGSADDVEAYNFFERKLLSDLLLGSAKHTSRHLLPGTTPLIFANRSKVFDGKYHMILPDLPKMPALVRASAEQQHEKEDGRYRPRKPQSRKKPPKKKGK